ncbi:protein of unknown function [Methylorubrum extorquens]|uniref:Uncharacterized protein n=1 Tax=Methylorubrum extorquens TaxID=408 RepID=A0A2N9ARN3_METEX|nr:protein of unknown function [Methylorubrum extorquens]
MPLTDLAREAMRTHVAHLTAEGSWLFPRRERERSSHPAGLRPRPQDRRCRRRPADRPGEPARSAPRLRQPSAPERRGSAYRPRIAGPCRYLDDADLYPRPR